MDSTLKLSKAGRGPINLRTLQYMAYYADMSIPEIEAQRPMNRRQRRWRDNGPEWGTRILQHVLNLSSEANTTDINAHLCETFSKCHCWPKCGNEDKCQKRIQNNWQDAVFVAIDTEHKPVRELGTFFLYI